MNQRHRINLPQVFQNFQGFFVKDFKEWRTDQRIEIILEREPIKEQYCKRCGCELGKYHDSHRVTAKHLKMMGWQVEVTFFKEKRHCSSCNKVRSESISWMSDASPHVTLDLAWWINVYH